MAEKFSYEKAKAELENILAELEEGEASIDTMAKQVKRASELIRLCKEKLYATDKEVQSVLEQLDENEEPRSM
jgi:exodeoxyribonuclease VII small subunit